MKRTFFLVIILLALPVFVFAQNKEVELYFFYGEGCPHCAKAKPFLESLRSKYANLKLYKYEVWSDQNNQAIFSAMAKAYNQEPQGVPTVFIGDEVIVGYDEASSPAQYLGAIEKCLSQDCPTPSEKLKQASFDAPPTNQIIGNNPSDINQNKEPLVVETPANNSSQDLFWILIIVVFLIFAGIFWFRRKPAAVK